MNVKTAIAELQSMNPNAEVALSYFVTADVTSRCRERKIKLTIGQKKQVLYKMQHNFDANQGFNWDTMDAAIDEVLEG